MPLPIDHPTRPAPGDRQSAAFGPPAPEGAPRVLTGPFVSRAEQHQLLDALDGWTTVVSMWRLELLALTARRLAPHAIVLSLDAPPGTDLAAIVRRIRLARPHAPIVCCATMRPGLGAQICDVVRAGASHLLWLGTGTRHVRDDLQRILVGTGAEADTPA